MQNKSYKHAKVRKNSKYIQVEACIHNVRYRFSTKLAINEANLEYVERNYKELIAQYKLECKEQEVSNNPYTLTRYGYQVLELEKQTCKDSTLLRYENVFKKYIVSHIGSMLIHDCSPKVVKEIFATKFQNLSFANRNIAVTILRKIFNHAISDEVYTKANPIMCIKRKKNTHIVSRNKPLSLEETLRIISFIENNSIDKQIGLYLKIALFTGMRVNEILALQYEDINTKQNVIHVNKTLSNGKITSTKTQSGIREVEIVEALKESIETLMQEQKSGFIFVNHKGRFLSQKSIRESFKQILQALHIETRTLYSTRHTFASLSLAYGEDLLWVANMLGHKDVSTTCKSYAKYIKQDKKRALFFSPNYKEVG